LVAGLIADITDEMLAHQQQLVFNLIFALAGFIVTELLLYLALVYGSRKLDSLIQRQTMEINQLKEFYKERSERDGLTGLYNHRCFNERLKQEMSHSRRSNSPLSLLMLDLDNFKSINDEFGHIAGDAVLENVSLIIGKVVRLSDFAGRYGGEEFIITLVDTELNDAVTIYCSSSNQADSCFRMSKSHGGGCLLQVLVLLSGMVEMIYQAWSTRRMRDYISPSSGVKIEWK
jgi:diguanylate cyclase (GGDEF)-like protein